MNYVSPTSNEVVTENKPDQTSPTPNYYFAVGTVTSVQAAPDQNQLQVTVTMQFPNGKFNYLLWWNAQDYRGAALYHLLLNACSNNKRVNITSSSAVSPGGYNYIYNATLLAS
ncbi:hypothetical protein TI10_11110 [Photorhabdus luminescens subsp. luminescens]|uniref:Uncharacterized protein n=1 Tax=Photorhabdus luminescens TaxID=29488 RepID=A0A1G5QYX0_PHOLU|nr:hypothetical protein [Photorhabdus luminescens]KMW72718.1 hypothetical protein TI10_11110 [Photorhabdus luminescens subsp. luminescens]MCW7764152.1 hypothetical protein [Photorhabdus luminescens subsp. venezuelensis]OWO84375.1 hypothetical protein B5C26_04940 [Photorhabdus luminescens]SCZ67035.1 hypothetical protein SAMN02982990_02680 [Photorhabdus luminescens]